MIRFCLIFVFAAAGLAATAALPREHICINENWRFVKGDPTNCAVNLLYAAREEKQLRHLAEAEADGNSSSNAAPISSIAANVPASVIKQWILPTGNRFIKDPARKFVRPAGNLDEGVAYVRPDFDDSGGRQINLPHDWAIEMDLGGEITGGQLFNGQVIFLFGAQT